MNAVKDERVYSDDVIQEDFSIADDEEIMRISDRLLEQHREAYIALANV